jgi:methyl-accepting chemotaxis protein
MAHEQGSFGRVSQWGPFRAVAGSVRNKVLLSMLALAVIPLVALGVIGYLSASRALGREAADELGAIDQLKRDAVIRLLKIWATDVQDVSTDPDVVEGMVGFRDGFRGLGAAEVRRLYLGKTDPAYNAEDGSAYSVEHRRQHTDFFQYYLAYHGYLDAFFIDRAGNVVYSFRKTGVFGTNLESGPLRDSNLAELFRQLKDAAEVDQVYLTDAARFEGEVAIFVGSPVFDPPDSANQVGILAYRARFEQVNDAMRGAAGLGATGDSYLVGADGLWRSDSRHLAELGVESTILNPQENLRIGGEAFTRAMAGETGTRLTTNYRDRTVLASWAPLTLKELTATDETGFYKKISTAIHWAVIAEIEQREVQAPAVALAGLTGGVTLVAIALVVVAALLLSGNLVRQIRAINELFAQIGIGNLKARARVVSSDESGAMARSLNAMLDQTLSLIQSRDERDRIQRSIEKLLEEVSGVAEGDLSGEAEVTTDVTGAIADSFNLMIAELRRIISKARDTSLQVSSAANEIQTTTEHLAQGSEAQALQIVDTSAAVDELAVSVQQVSDSSGQAAGVAEQALQNARQGADAVSKTIHGMSGIRQQVQETAKRIKRLGESSQEVGEIVELIGDIADRTSILALNASIQAAMAGEAGRGFAVVAEEVERLAERSAEATKRIATLIKSIQSETTEAVAAMEATTREVVGGSSLANEAGQALEAIQSVSGRLAEIIQSISLAAKQQARGSEGVARAMGEISEVTQQTSAGTKQAAVSIRNLAELADELRESMERFRLPQRTGKAA